MEFDTPTARRGIMYNVIKRDGKIVDFDLSKISTAIYQAFDACQKQYNKDIIDFLALKELKTSLREIV